MYEESDMIFRVESQGKFNDHYTVTDYLQGKIHSMSIVKKTAYVSCGCGVLDCSHKESFKETFKYRYLNL